MTYTITSQCISCDRCLSICPTHAIQSNGQTYSIDPNHCNSCIGHYSVPQCWSVCPTNEGCITFTDGVTAVELTSASESSSDYWESWFTTYDRMVARLKANQQSDYWRHWFDAYAAALTKQFKSHRSQAIEVSRWA
ncbi:MAG: 4Fe-4S ferredoxin [Cyanothece sp. SIO1E1]|nr:4Fe-4S ferredoxin [Cyanothece sp. SIO1E1]